MSERVTVTVKVRKVEVESAIKLLHKSEGKYADIWESGDFNFLAYTEVKYGDLHGLNELVTAGIPFDATWEAGHDFGSGTLYSRYDEDGNRDSVEVFDSDINPSLEGLITRINNHAELKKFILEHQRKVTPLSWEYQEENVKLFKTKSLIGAVETAEQ